MIERTSSAIGAEEEDAKATRKMANEWETNLQWQLGRMEHRRPALRSSMVWSDPQRRLPGTRQAPANTRVDNDPGSARTREFVGSTRDSRTPRDPARGAGGLVRLALVPDRPSEPGDSRHAADDGVLRAAVHAVAHEETAGDGGQAGTFGNGCFGTSSFGWNAGGGGGRLLAM